jgi:hypothetical protein
VPKRVFPGFHAQLKATLQIKEYILQCDRRHGFNFLGKVSFDAADGARLFLVETFLFIKSHRKEYVGVKSGDLVGQRSFQMT